MSPAAAAACAELEQLGELEGDPRGSWRLRSCKAMTRFAALKSAPLTTMRSCRLFVSEDGPALGQFDAWFEFELNASDDPALAVRLRFSGVVGFADYDLCSAVWLRADALPPTHGGFALVQAALAPSLPPGAIRAKHDVLWLDEELCVLRSGPKDAPDSLVVLQRADEDFDRGDADDDVVEDEDDDVDEGEELWVGSPY